MTYYLQVKDQIVESFLWYAVMEPHCEEERIETKKKNLFMYRKYSVAAVSSLSISSHLNIMRHSQLHECPACLRSSRETLCTWTCCQKYINSPSAQSFPHNYIWNPQTHIASFISIQKCPGSRETNCGANICVLLLLQLWQYVFFSPCILILKAWFSGNKCE